MGEYVAILTCPRHLRAAGESTCLEGFYAALAGEGLQPVGEPRVSWHKVSREEAAQDPPSRPGYWRVRITVDVAEALP